MNRFGPSHDAVMKVLQQIGELDGAGIRAILECHRVVGMDTVASYAAWAAAPTGDSACVALAAEEARRRVWETILDCSWEEAWTLSFIASRAAVGAATSHLVETGGYTIEHYITLAGVWSAGFPEKGN